MSSKRKEWISGVIIAIVVPLVMFWLFYGCRSTDDPKPTDVVTPPTADVAARVHSVDQYRWTGEMHNELMRALLIAWRSRYASKAAACAAAVASLRQEKVQGFELTVSVRADILSTLAKLSVCGGAIKMSTFKRASWITPVSAQGDITVYPSSQAETYAAEIEGYYNNASSSSGLASALSPYYGYASSMSWPDDEHVASSADYFQGIYDNYHPTTGFVSDVDAQIDWYNSCELGQNENAQWSDDTNTYQCTNSEWRVISRPSRSAGPPPLRSVALTTPNCSHTAGDGVAYVGGADIIAMQLWFGINGPYKLLAGITRWSAWQGGVYTGAAASAVALGLWAWDHRAC